MTSLNLLDALIEDCGLSHRREQIHALVRPARLLVTRTLVTHESPEPGRSRLGGLPDLPPDATWPRHRDGRPLAFLGQVDLAQVVGAQVVGAQVVGAQVVGAQVDLAQVVGAQVHLAEAGPAGVAPPGLPGFPTTGLLWLFSVYGWRDEEGAWDPFVWNNDPDPTWTRVLYVERPTGLVATPPPAPVNLFPSTTIGFRPHSALPTDEGEPALAALQWPGEDLDALEELVEGYHETILRQEGASALNLLGGYAVYEQGAVTPAVDEDMPLLLQVGSDPNAGMTWGDGGFLYVWIRSADLAARRFDRLVVRTQCG